MSSMLRSLLSTPSTSTSTTANRLSPIVIMPTAPIPNVPAAIKSPKLADCKPRGSKKASTAAKHNDATFYPNIRCVICQEWVCSRNRYLHVESHLQYRPYRCSVCAYDNRKQIFISLHLKRNHNGLGEVLYQPDPQVERRAWQIAEECLEYTRRLLIGNDNGDKTQLEETSSVAMLTAEESMRPRIHNALRAEKTELIEQNRQLGLVPVFPLLADHEVECRQCHKHVVKLPYSHLEEHIRLHLSVPSYACPEQNCWEQHNSRGFMIRHMKEVHSHCRGIVDLMRKPAGQLIFEEFCREAVDCFTDDQIATAVVHRVRQRLSHTDKNVYSMADTEWLDFLPLSSSSIDETIETQGGFGWNPCLGCHIGLSLTAPVNNTAEGAVQPCVNCYKRLFEAKTGGYGVQICQICHRKLIGTGSTWDQHSLGHLDSAPFRCSGCERYEHSDSEAVEEHLRLEHPDEPVGITVVWDNPDLMVDRWRLKRSECFPQLTATVEEERGKIDEMLKISCGRLGLDEWQMSPRVRVIRLAE